jgi:hypothetical protein
MSTPWVFSSTFLPYTGEPIDFLLEDREEPIHGTFDGGTFHSRWANYDSSRVRSWRQALVDPAHEVIEPPHIETPWRVFAALKRVAHRLVGRSRRVAPAPNSASHARRVAQTAQGLIGTARTATQQTHSNQISS